jgi:tetratricopeptide (TPR) repeat protein
MNATPITPNHRTPVWLEALGIILLMALVCLLAWPGMKAPLLLDDVDQMIHAKGFLSWKDCIGRDCYGLFRPVKNLIYYSFGDLSLFTWHSLNLSIYLGSVLAVFLWLRRLLGSFAWALTAAALWATCPTQASSAVWMSCANISLAITLACACLYGHDLAQSKPGANLKLTALACLCLFLAQCSYEAAVSVPALCVLVDLLRKRPLFSRVTLARYALLAAVTLAYLVIRSRLGAVLSAFSANPCFAPNLTGWQLSLSAPWFLWRHFSMWLMPAGRIEFCGTYIWGISATPWDLAAAWAWLLLLTGAVIFSWKRHPWVACGVLWFLIASFPSSNFIPIWAGPIADYYLVFPGIGLAIALVGCAKAILEWIKRERLDPESQRPLIGGAVLFFVAFWRLLCLPLFWLQASLWCRPLELFLRCDLTRPAQFQVQALAARELLASGQPEQAKELALQSYSTGPWHGTNSLILGRVAYDTADYTEAEQRFREVLRNTLDQTPTHDYAQFYLAQTFMAQESKRQLVRETLLPLLSNPRSASHLDAINLQIDYYLARNQPNDAHRTAAKAVQLHPENRQLIGRLKDIETKFPNSAATQPPPR